MVICTKKLPENYGKVVFATDDHTGTGSFAELPNNMDFSYYDHATKDMDTFHAMEDYMEIRALYKSFRAISDAQDFDPLRRAVSNAAYLVNALVALQNSQGKALIEHAPKWVKIKMLENAAKSIGRSPQADG